MTIYDIKRHAEEMGVPLREALFHRFRYVRAEMFRELEEMNALYSDETTAAVMETLSLKRFIELAKEQRALLMAVKHKDTPGGITDEQIETARNADIRPLIGFNRQGKATAPCHDDKRPSLVFLGRTGKAWCPVCDRKFNAVDWLIEVEGLSFPEAVRRLAA